MQELTDAQARVLAFIRKTIDEDVAPPTFRDIAREFGFASTRAAQDHVAALVRKGYVDRLPGVARGLRLTSQSQPSKPNAVGVPILGVVVASAPREAFSANLGSLPVPRDLARGRDGELFALRVKGDSMIDAGILEGDYVIAREQKTAANGDIVVALLDGESTVKRFSKTGTRITLVPENKRMKPIPVERDELQIQGRVIGVQRYFR